MRIKIKAWLFAPGYLTPIGGKNPPILTGEFEIELTKRHLLTLLSESKHINYQGIYLAVSKVEKDLILICQGQLKNVSVEYFKKLQERGWILDQGAALKYSFPNDETNQKLQSHYVEQKENAKRIVHFQKITSSATKKWLRKFRKTPTPLS